MKTKLVFCAGEQKEIDHVVSVSDSGEWVFECSGCGRVLKFAANLSGDQVNALLATHKEANAGQITKESLEAKLADL